MKRKPRYTFFRVAAVVTGIYILLGLMGLIMMSVMPNTTAPDFKKLWSLRSITGQVITIGFSSVFYYLLINHYYRLFIDAKTFRSFIRPTLLAVVGIFIFYFLYEFTISKNPPKMAVNGKDIKVTISVLIVGYSISAVFYTGISLLIAYLTNLRDEKKEKKILEQQALKLEAEKSYANFNFLKAQINPHFLHNTLNFLYAKSLPYSAELSEGILILSDIMRYALNQNIAADGKVPLDDELEHMGNVIKINQLRFSNRLSIDFETKGQTSNARIIPFVLITLVENAFKHGDLTQPDHPLRIRLAVHDQELTFSCHNKKKTGLKELSTGLGLDNIKKRLQLTYGNDFCLTVNEDEQFYTTELNITKL